MNLSKETNKGGKKIKIGQTAKVTKVTKTDRSSQAIIKSESPVALKAKAKQETTASSRLPKKVSKTSLSPVSLKSRISKLKSVSVSRREIKVKLNGQKEEKDQVQLDSKTTSKELVPMTTSVKEKPVAKKIIVKEPKQEQAKEALSKEPSSVLKEETEERYIETVGKRKTAIARVRVIIQGQGKFFINHHSFEHYCLNAHRQKTISVVLGMIRKIKPGYKPDISVIVKGGGFHSQLEAIRHGLAKILAKIDQEAKKEVKKMGYLIRDSRIRERKKPGLKRARKATQWRKR